MALGLNGGPAAPARRWRRVAWLALVVGVSVVHGCVTRQISQRMGELNATDAMPVRIEVAYVREMALAVPPPAAAPAAPPAPPARVARVKPPKAPKPASAPEPKPVLDAEVAVDPAPVPEAPAILVATAAEPAPAARAEPVPPAPDAVASMPESVAAASAPETLPPSASPAAAAASAPGGDTRAAFEWPASTRMSYLLSGWYNGEVQGSAQVEWIRAGSRYQVHLDLVVGPSVAPVVTRRMSSDGEITAQGLAPRRYDQETKVVLLDRRRATLAFEPGSVVLANGDRRDAPAGVQDTASQFVQLTYVFSTRPELLRVGGSVEIPLALPHKVDVWTYDVVAEEILYTPFGPLPSVHLKPRRRAVPKANELSVEIWFAPQLRYLPARILIRQDADNFADLLISRRPEMGS